MVAALIMNANTIVMKTDGIIQLHCLVCPYYMNIRRSYLIFRVPPSFKIEMVAALIMNGTSEARVKILWSNLQ